MLQMTRSIGQGYNFMDLSEIDRQWAMGILARAGTEQLVSAWDAWQPQPSFTWLRKPETGLVMVRGRMGGEGDAFNLGEMTVTRCAIVLDGGVVGHACTQGRSHRKAELAAVIDALHQQPETRQELRSKILAPLAERLEAERSKRSQASEPTKVQFFTRVRGED